QGDSDRIVPFSAAGQRTAKLINGAELVVIKDGPHNIAWTHADEVNSALMSFLAKPAAKTQATAPRTKAVA
ncbi:MAG: alpha/beta hydrolase, partial [Candidatus Sulfotelmatobacter sp.]